MSPLRRFTTLALSAALTLSAAPAVTGTAMAAPAPVMAVDSGVEHGPAPTATSITRNGPYAYASTRISRFSVRGFGGGTLYYPTSGAAGETFAGIVTIPGYYEPGSVMNLYGPRLASHGFVVLVADVNSVASYPDARAAAAEAAVAYLKSSPVVSGKLDASRIALMGHSMGGGGVLTAAEELDLDAVVAVHPWAEQGFPGVTEPTFVIGGLLDNIAPVPQYTVPIYASLTGVSDKGMLTHLTGSHWAGVTDDPAIQGRTLAFLKTFVDGDQRYRTYWCAPAAAGTTFRSTC